MSLYQDIRGVLQVRAATATGFPSSVSYEGVAFTEPTDGSSYARMVMIPASGRAFSVDAGTKDHIGLFRVDIFSPSGAGTATAESLADAVKDVFEPSTRISLNGTRVFITYSERTGSIFADPEWIQVPVTVAWRAFSSNN